ncbi:alpha/beta hydrolase family protein [Kocuria rosea]|uniref:alpha/beta hydrolase family protein n=1 Tax=Kocuria rosea TaxID=1275 RepID=UPI003015A79A
MYEYFPTNYVWNLATNIALNTGGHITEIDEICRPLLEVSAGGDDEGTEAFFEAWCARADRLVELAEQDQAAGHDLSAARKYERASVYYLTAERQQSRHFAPRQEAYRKMLETFEKAITCGQRNCERVVIPYEGTTLPGLFVRAQGVTGPAPTMVHYNGLDSTKEMIYGSGIADELAARGINTLMVDHPGVGEALRLQGLTGYANSERWSGPVVDYLETRPEVENTRIGVMAWSLGGYYAPRAAAFEKRFALCVAWGANYNWGEMQKRRQAKEGSNPVPHYWDHVQWVFGKDSMDSFMAFAPQMSLEGVVEKIEVPFLVTHGANDRQIPLEYAYAQYEAATASPKRELRIFTAEEGGAEHVSADNMSIATSYISDWVAENL